MLGRLFSRFRAAEAGVRVDDHPRLAEAEALFAAGDWPALTAMVAEETPNGALALVRALGNHTPLDAPLAALPDTPAEMAVQGGVLVGWAWRHRGFGTADEVSEDAWTPFFETLDQAIGALLPAVRADHHDGVALSFLVRAATGAQNQGLLTEAGDLLERARRRPLEGLAWLMQGRGAKWGGSHAAMDAVAESQRLDDDQHPARLALAARGLIERWLYDGSMAGDAVTHYRGQALFALKATSDRIERLSDDYERLLSVWDEAEADIHAERFAHSQIGMAAYQSKRWPVARRHVEALGDAPSEWPWTYALGDVARRWPEVKRRVRR